MLRESLLYRRKENGVLQEHLGQDTRHDQDQRAADARCDLSKGQKLHALCRRQHGDVARAAHVRGAKTGGNGGFDGVETDEVTIHNGDIVFGDIDGVLIIPKEIAPEVIEKALIKASTEKTTRKAIEDGMMVTEAFAKFGVL